MHLTVSFAKKKKSYFLDLRFKSYGCLKFLGEVWAWRACAGANEEELIIRKKIWGQEGGGKGVGGWNKGGPTGARLTTSGRRLPTPPQLNDRWSAAVTWRAQPVCRRWRLAVACRLWLQPPCPDRPLLIFNF
jgi:hypothetical protein